MRITAVARLGSTVVRDEDEQRIIEDAGFCCGRINITDQSVDFMVRCG